MKFVKLKGFSVFLCKRENCFLTPRACVARQLIGSQKYKANILNEKCRDCDQGKKIAGLLGKKDILEVNQEATKTCRKCKRELSMDNYTPNGFGYFSSSCKDCQADIRREAIGKRKRLREMVQCN